MATRTDSAEQPTKENNDAGNQAKALDSSKLSLGLIHKQMRFLMAKVDEQNTTIDSLVAERERTQQAYNASDLLQKEQNRKLLDRLQEQSAARSASDRKHQKQIAAAQAEAQAGKAQLRALYEQHQQERAFHAKEVEALHEALAQSKARAGDLEEQRDEALREFDEVVRQKVAALLRLSELHQAMHDNHLELSEISASARASTKDSQRGRSEGPSEAYSTVFDAFMFGRPQSDDSETESASEDWDWRVKRVREYVQAFERHHVSQGRPQVAQHNAAAGRRDGAEGGSSRWWQPWRQGEEKEFESAQEGPSRQIQINPGLLSVNLRGLRGAELA